ncbi:MAG: type IVB secretion system protein IcmH/DotU [Gammaproteobacteria bacterium]|nr:type IVB secretion system protein IcmH/DotU [Gammaproteobacteria bacterium]
MADNKILGICSGFFMLSKPLILGNNLDDLDDSYVLKIKSEISRIEENAFSMQCTPFVVEYIKYALVSLIDDLILNSESPIKAKWFEQPLQLLYFGERTAGENFFVRLHELMQGSAKYLDLLELYFICLEFGFMGKYRLLSLSQLLVERHNLWQKISLLRDDKQHALSLYSGRDDYLFNKVKNLFPPWVLCLVSLLCVVLIYSGYSLAINYKSKYSLLKMKELSNRIILQ